MNYPFPKIDMRLNNLRLISVGEHLTDIEPYITAEIVLYYEEDRSITMAFWKSTKEGFNIEFCGSRPFKEGIEVIDFWRLLFYGQEILDHYFWLTHPNSD